MRLLGPGNSAEGRGGAVITQIEKPDSQSVVLTNCQFCFVGFPPLPQRMYREGRFCLLQKFIWFSYALTLGLAVCYSYRCLFSSIE